MVGMSNALTEICGRNDRIGTGRQMDTQRTDPPLWMRREQQLLLQAALAEGERAAKAWDQWSSEFDIEQLGARSQRLLPLLYRNMQRHGVKHPSVRMARGVHRLNWYKNHMLFRKLVPILRSFQDNGIETMLLKGAALTLLFYRDHGARPMSDLDLLVPKVHVRPAISLLRELGWMPKQVALSRPFSDVFFSVRHAYAFNDANDGQIDLHWHVMKECCYPGADADFWQGSVPIVIEGVPTRALNPTDQLFHVCVDAVPGNSVQARYAADAMVILVRSHAEIDWSRLVSQAQARHLVLRVRRVFNYLRQEFDAPIPSPVVRELQESTVSELEWQETTAFGRPGEPAGPMVSLRRRYLGYMRWAIGSGVPTHRTGFPRFLQGALGASHLWLVPVAALPGGLRRLQKRVRWIVQGLGGKLRRK